MSDGSDLDVGDDFISAIDIGSLIGVANGERVLQRDRGDSMAGDEGPVNAIDLSSRVNDGSGSDSVQGGRRDNDRDRDVQRMFSTVCSLGDDNGGDWGCQGWRGLWGCYGW